MKLFFTEYIPVEGKPVIGDKVLDNEGEITEISQFLYDEYEKNQLWYLNKKVELFLCTRHIKEGDKVKVTKNFIDWFDDIVVEIRDENGYFTDAQDKSTTGSWYRPIEIFKVIGKISPDALSYVKRGQEIDSLDWEWSEQLYKERPYLTSADSYRIHHDVKNAICIKGPCGHFH